VLFEAIRAENSCFDLDQRNILRPRLNSDPSTARVN